LSQKDIRARPCSTRACARSSSFRSHKTSAMPVSTRAWAPRCCPPPRRWISPPPRRA